MSHKATNWLSSIPAKALTNSEFRVLFHLCDCHNPSQGCFPTQAYLIDCCGISNGTLNNALNGLEAKGLIARHQERDGRTRRQKPTRYVLGFELGAAKEPSPASGGGAGAKPSPRTGGGKQGKRSPETGDGAVSNLRADPSPISAGSRLQPTGEVTCKEPVINPRAAREGSKNPLVVAEAERAIRVFREGRQDALRELKPWVQDHIRNAELLTPDERQRSGLF
ncbi:Helix-turn-helix domain-containing protein [Pseudooceanicola antarcticus]|uniref:Helix-turn-helix domain-containing protein n=1 Tax=Pseudooceanicola antarcticus TaxID=1247613 RepID=A0A285J505_9RHOB|nr:helix-turn-helix domain-containing protein [Pseudooceanicola antarcticus]PJE26828.1 helix-turn-helix domain-containing protein [Pseudooceanicola antarcticus]SNY55409.1 Helix-turn-helix domain-containing protein [Pseudooceanicola antarcticus]